MNPKITKELKKATEELQAKMLVMQDAEAKMLKLKTAFVNEKDEVKRETLKKAILKMHKELKAAETEAEKADANFHRILATEPDEEIEDLLDHKIQEHIVRMRVRKLVKESFNKLNKKRK